MFKKTVLASALGVVLSAGLVGAAKADVLAQSILTVTGFTISISDPTAVGVIAGSNKAGASYTWSGSPGSDVKGQTLPFMGATPAPVSASVFAGTPGYVPYTELSAPSATFIAGNASLTGSSLAPGGANAKTDAVVSFVTAGSGESSSNLGLTASYTIIIEKSASLGFDFFADPYAIAVVNPSFSALAGLAYAISIQQGSNELFDWEPNGTGARALAGGGNVTYDPCTLNNNSGQTLAGQTSYDPACLNPVGSGGAAGQFSADTQVFAPGTYQLTVTHFSNASAISVVPEPASLLLVGSALLGMAAAGRRRAKR